MSVYERLIGAKPHVKPYNYEDYLRPPVKFTTRLIYEMRPFWAFRWQWDGQSPIDDHWPVGTEVPTFKISEDHLVSDHGRAASIDLLIADWNCILWNDRSFAILYSRSNLKPTTAPLSTKCHLTHEIILRTVTAPLAHLGSHLWLSLSLLTSERLLVQLPLIQTGNSDVTDPS